MVEVALIFLGNKTVLKVPYKYTIREIFNVNGFEVSRGIILLNGTRISTEELSKTLSDFGICNNCILSNIFKADESL